VLPEKLLADHEARLGVSGAKLKGFEPVADGCAAVASGRGDEAEAVVRLGLVRLERDELFQHSLRVLEAVEVVERDAEVVEDFGRVRSEGVGAPEEADGALVLARLGEAEGEGEEDARVVVGESFNPVGEHARFAAPAGVGVGVDERQEERRVGVGGN
jgi:hypothetical protein